MTGHALQPRRRAALLGPRLVRLRGASGQAAVELVGSLPALLLLAAVLLQLLAVGYAAVLAGQGSEAGALAMVTGRNPREAVREALPGWAGRRVAVTAARGAVQVSLRPPALLPGAGRVLEVRSRAAVAGPGR